MCGIAGFCNKEIDQNKNIEKMNRALINRGPDAGGSWLDEETGVTFGHRRLAIVDISPRGAQPMISSDQRFVMTYNGEVYNATEIKDELISNNIFKDFKGTSDTEVVLESFGAWGIDAVKKFTGMFAIALYDRLEKKLYLFRDRMGEKPLYYGWVNNHFVFASDLSGIKAIEGFEGKLSEDILRMYLLYGYIPGSHTIYKDIYKLKPGEILGISYPFTEYNLKKYWDINNIAKKRYSLLEGEDEQYLTLQFDKLLVNSIQRQLQADVPVGVLLSGGIDSTLVTAIAQNISAERVKTFTIGIEGENNEANHAKAISDYLGTDHTELYISESKIKELIPSMPLVYSEPFADNSQLATCLVSELARKQVTVTLSGDGGDELFCGYPMYQKIEKIWEDVQKNKLPWYSEEEYKYRNYMKCERAEDVYKEWYHYSPLIDNMVFSKQISDSTMDIYSRGHLKDIKSNLMLMDQQMYMPDDILTKVDRASMYYSLENRVPLLDKEIVEFAWGLPISYKYNGETGKVIMRNLLKNYVPASLWNRPKQGFNIPVKRLIKNTGLRDWAEELLDETVLRQEGIFNVENIRLMWKKYLRDDEWRPILWYILMFEAWMRKVG